MKVNQSNLINPYGIDQLNNQRFNKTSNTGKNAQTISPDPANEDLFQRTLDARLAENSQGQTTYMNPQITMDSAIIENLLKETEGIQSSVNQLIQGLLERQGLTIAQLKDRENLQVDEIARQEAERMIGPGGDLSPEKVSDRIISFAINAFGGDKSKIDIIRSSIDQGFAEAKHILGELADVSKETYELIQDKLEAWMNEGEQETKKVTEE